MGVNLTINNNTSGKAYYLVWGFADNMTVDDAPWSYLQQDGPDASQLIPLPTPPNKVSGASKSNVDLITELAPGQSIEFKNIPHIISGNILLSFKQRPQLFAVVPALQQDGKTTIPEHGGWGVQTPGFTPGNLDENTIFCSSELTLDDSGIWADTTTVDYFAAPVTVQVDGSIGTQLSGALNPGVTRDDVFSAFANITDPRLSSFKKLIMGNNVRVLAPGHAVDAPLSAIPANYFDAYVNHCLSLYTAKDSLQVKVGGTFDGTYLGTANTTTNTISFVNSDGTGSVGSITIPPGSARSIFLCDGVLSAPNNVIGNITAVICAALNRTVLHKGAMQPYCLSSDFYGTADESQDWWATNYYSKLLHDNIAKVYGFAFDDVCNNSMYKPLLHDPQPTAVTITLESWT